jgi:hypothetical protein
MGAACFAIAFTSTALLGLLAMPSGCGEQDVIIATAGDTGDARDGATVFGGGDSGSPCSVGSNAGRPCFGDGGANSSCMDDGEGGLPCPDSGDSGPQPDGEEDGGKSCRSNNDCPNESFFCSKQSCVAPTGQCQQRPLTCDNAPENGGPLVCGCDGVNYWNDCLRRADGVASTSLMSQCMGSPSAECDGGVPPHTTCPVSDAFCFVPCGATVGTCWVLPDECPGDAGVSDWESCNPQHTCDDLCTAIQSGIPHTHSGPGMECR